MDRLSSPLPPGSGPRSEPVLTITLTLSLLLLIGSLITFQLIPSRPRNNSEISHQGKILLLFFRRCCEFFTLSAICAIPSIWIQGGIGYTLTFSMLAVYMLGQCWTEFLQIKQRQGGSVINVRGIPPSLCEEQALADYFTQLNFRPEVVKIGRDVTPLVDLLHRRTLALETYEKTPTDVHLALFKKWDVAFKSHRSTSLKHVHEAFVKLANPAQAILASQVLFSPIPGQMRVTLAAEDKDIYWPNMFLPSWERYLRNGVVYLIMAILLTAWIAPVSALSVLLNFKEIEKVWPGLAKWLNGYPLLKKTVMDSLPAVGLIAFNAVVPYFLQGLCYAQGIEATSRIQKSLLRKYSLFLFSSVLLVFLVAQTYWTLARELAEAPLSVPQKLAAALRGPAAQNFFLSYVCLSGIGLLPIQLVIPAIPYRLKNTPRMIAQQFAPRSLSYGMIFPPAILIFSISLLYSITTPLILPFAATYFFIAHVVYKYLLTHVYVDLSCVSGAFWPEVSTLCTCGVIMFQLFMLGLFTLDNRIIESTLMLPVILGTVFWAFWHRDRYYKVSRHVAIEVELLEEEPKLSSSLALDSYVAPAVKGTDFVSKNQLQVISFITELLSKAEPPESTYPGILHTIGENTIYTHPVLTGILPEPWIDPAETNGDFLRLPLQKDWQNTNMFRKDPETQSKFSKLSLNPWAGRRIQLMNSQYAPLPSFERDISRDS